MPESAQLIDRKITGPGQHAVPHGGDVTIGQEEEILAFPFHGEGAFVMEDVKVQGDHKFGAS